jgi:hypothetical protein
MNDNIHMDSTMVGSMNDNINMDSTMVGSMNDNIHMDSTRGFKVGRYPVLPSLTQG